jgi:hypothetical protein
MITIKRGGWILSRRAWCRQSTEAGEKSAVYADLT